MTLIKLSLLAAGVASVSALASAPVGQSQRPLGQDADVAGLGCRLPPSLAPVDDGLLSSESLFSSDEALLKQVERHQAIVRVPSICYDDLGEFDDDKRWAPFWDLHDVLAETYPTM